jgi:hypothetical protein
VGVNVEPLGEVLMAGFPDGFRPLFAPGAALPALLPVVEVPVVVPFVDEPVVVPLAAGPPTAELPPAEPPLCANANVLVSARAAANPIVTSLMVRFPLLVLSKNKPLDDLPFPSVMSGFASAGADRPAIQLSGPHRFMPGGHVSSARNQAGHRLLYNPGKAAIVIFKIDDVKDCRSD